MKSILLSIKPKYVSMILNKTKTIEVRKRFPSDYVGWVYIYVTKNHKHAGWKNRDTLKRDSHDGKPTNHFQLWTDDMVEDKDKLNGKVVARFWCDKVEEILFDLAEKEWFTDTLEEKELLKQSCLSQEELDDYLQAKNGCAIHITKLEIFDRPKEISKFHKVDKSWGFICYNCPHFYTDDSAGYSIDSCDLGFENCEKTKLTRAPQSWCYIEV